MALRPASAWVPIAIIGGLVVLLGIAFVTIRPAFVLLPEDQRFTGLSPEALQTMNPRLFTWIGLVFRSWGAFAIGLGVLILSIAATGFRRGDRWTWWALALSGSSTLAIFLAVNIVLVRTLSSSLRSSPSSMPLRCGAAHVRKERAPTPV